MSKKKDVTDKMEDDEEDIFQTSSVVVPILQYTLPCLYPYSWSGTRIRTYDVVPVSLPVSLPVLV